MGLKNQLCGPGAAGSPLCPEMDTAVASSRDKRHLRAVQRPCRPGAQASTCVLSFQSCPTLCDPVDFSLKGPSVRGILQARILKGCPCSPPGDLPHPGTEPMSLVSPALAGGFFTTSITWEAPQVALTLMRLAHAGVHTVFAGLDRKLSWGFSRGFRRACPAGCSRHLAVRAGSPPGRISLRGLGCCMDQTRLERTEHRAQSYARPEVMETETQGRPMVSIPQEGEIQGHGSRDMAGLQQERVVIQQHLGTADSCRPGPLWPAHLLFVS